MNTAIKVTEKKNVQTSLKNLRPHFPKGTPDLEILAELLRNGESELTPAKLLEFAKSKKRFSTADAMQAFQAGKYKVAGSLASLSGQRRIEKTADVDANGYSVYVYVTE